MRPIQDGNQVHRTLAAAAVGVAVATLALASAAAAGGRMEHGSGGPGGGAAFGEGRRGPEAMAEELGLSAEQKTALGKLHDALRAQVEPLFTERRKLEETLHAELESESPNAERVGETAIAIHGLMRKAGDAHRAFHEQFLALLTPEQKAKQEALEAEHPRWKRPGGPGPDHEGWLPPPPEAGAAPGAPGGMRNTGDE